MKLEYHLPVRPYSPIDAHNRAAAAKGSPRYAMLASRADYNGHHISLTWNSYRKYYVAEYFWAGRVVLCRGSFEPCLQAVLREYNRGALGASATIRPREDDQEAIQACENEPLLVKGSLWQEEPSGMRSLKHGDWYTWRHQTAAEATRDMAHPRTSVLIFDWPLMQKAESREEYEKLLQEKYGRTYA